jgi:hypothetical protein
MKKTIKHFKVLKLKNSFKKNKVQKHKNKQITLKKFPSLQINVSNKSKFNIFNKKKSHKMKNKKGGASWFGKTVDNNNAPSTSDNGALSSAPSPSEQEQQVLNTSSSVSETQKNSYLPPTQGEPFTPVFINDKEETTIDVNTIGMYRNAVLTKIQETTGDTNNLKNINSQYNFKIYKVLCDAININNNEKQSLLVDDNSPKYIIYCNDDVEYPNFNVIFSVNGVLHHDYINKMDIDSVMLNPQIIIKGTKYTYSFKSKEDLFKTSLDNNASTLPSTQL